MCWICPCAQYAPARTTCRRGIGMNRSYPKRNRIALAHSIYQQIKLYIQYPHTFIEKKVYMCTFTFILNRTSLTISHKKYNSFNINLTKLMEIIIYVCNIKSVYLNPPQYSGYQQIAYISKNKASSIFLHNTSFRSKLQFGLAFLN